jgi:hypothetical protein
VKVQFPFLIVTVAAGALLLLALIIGLIVWRRRRANSSSNSDSSLSSDVRTTKSSVVITESGDPFPDTVTEDNGPDDVQTQLNFVDDAAESTTGVGSLLTEFL